MLRRSSLLGPVLLLALSTAVLPASPAAATALGNGSYTFTGAGFGHGVGMSQYGAKAFAEAGWDPGRILTHYYRGTAISQRTSGALRVHLADIASTSFTTSGPIRVTADGVPGAGPVFPDTTPAGAPPVVLEADPAGNGVLVKQNGSVLMRAPGSVALSPEASPASDCGADVVSRGPCVGLAATGKRYRYGATEVRRFGAGLRLVVRDLPVEKYLYGLAEMPSSWNPNALQVQAVAGRTYALDRQARLGNDRSTCACTLVSSEGDQVYAGLEKEAGSTPVLQGYARAWRGAVDTTAGKVVTYDGALITAFYSSSSGGYTENNENVFGGTPLPYLRGVPDADDNPANPNRSWTRSYPASALSSWFAADPRTSVGTLTAIEVNGRFGVSGLPLEVVLRGTGGVKTVDGYTVRSVVNAGARGCATSNPSVCRTLPSGLFQVGWEGYERTFRGGVFVAGGGDGNPLFVTGADAGRAATVAVRRSDGSTPESWDAYPGFTGGARVAVCKVAGGPPRVVTAPGPGGGPDVRVRTLQGALVRNWYAYAPGFSGGVYVGCGDVDGDGTDEVMTGAGPGGGPDVGVWRLDGTKVDGFFAFDAAFRGGVRVAGGQLAGDGRAEVVAAAGPGGGPEVRVVTDAGRATRRYAAGGVFMASDAGDRRGVYVAVAEGAPTGAVVTGTGDGGASRVVARRLGEPALVDRTVFGPQMASGARVGWAPGLGVLASAGVGAWPLVRAVP